MSRRSRSSSRLAREILDVIECEQRRLGRDLHDGLCQEMTGLAFLIHSMQQRPEPAGRMRANEFAELTALIRTALKHARGIARGLDPVAAEPHGLPVALEQLATDTTAASRVRCAFHHPQPVEVPNPLTATHLYRIAQDAVWDAVRRGSAHEILIELRRIPDGIELVIGDDGIDGISQPCALRMMKHRARVIGAMLKLYNGAKGARVVCRLTENKPLWQRGRHENHQSRRGQARSESSSDGEAPSIHRRRSCDRSPRTR